MACVALAVLLAPVPAPPGRALARAPSGPVHARVHPSRYDGPLRCATRQGRLGEPVRSHGIHAPRPLAPYDGRPSRGRACQGARRLRLGAPAGAAMAYTPREGRAVRGGSPRGGVSLGLRPLEPPRARGARYALGEVRRRKSRGKRGLAGERVSRQAAEDEAGGQEGGGGQGEEKDVRGVWQARRAATVGGAVGGHGCDLSRGCTGLSAGRAVSGAGR